MIANITSGLDFHANALVLRAERQRVIASNIANADTPGFVARDINFRDAMSNAMQPRQATRGTTPATNPRHIALSNAGNTATRLDYAPQNQPTADGNSVDMDRERANFVDNAVRYESTLRFINGQSRTILSAIQGQ